MKLRYIAISGLFILSNTVSASTTDFSYVFNNSISASKTVAYDYFSIFDTVNVNIQSFDEYALGNKKHGFDPSIFVFEWNPLVGFGDKLAFDDDHGVKAFSFDNAFLNITLDPGSYAVAVSDYYFNESDARSGVNTNISISGTKFGSYELHVDSVSPVPEPSTLALIFAGTGLVGFVAARRR